MLMTFFMFAKRWKIHHQKNLWYIINIYFKYLKKLDKVYDDHKD